MKNKILIIATLAGSLVLSSCEDFLTHDNTTSANQETFFDTDEALEAATAPLITMCGTDFNDEKPYYSMGDGRANDITARWSDYIYPYTNFTETALSPGLEDAWGSFYSVVAQSNYAINNIKDYSGPQVSVKSRKYKLMPKHASCADWHTGTSALYGTKVSSMKIRQNK